METSRSEPPAVPEGGAAAAVPAGSEPAALAAAAVPAGSEPAALAATAVSPVTPAAAAPAADALSAMLAAAIPGTSFADPLGGAGQPAPEAGPSSTSQDGDPSSANGAETGGQSLT